MRRSAQPPSIAELADRIDATGSTSRILHAGAVALVGAVAGRRGPLHDVNVRDRCYALARELVARDAAASGERRLLEAIDSGELARFARALAVLTRAVGG